MEIGADTTTLQPTRLFLRHAPGGGKSDQPLSFGDCIAKVCGLGCTVEGFPNVDVPDDLDGETIAEDIEQAYSDLANKCPGYQKYPTKGAAMIDRLTPCEAKAIMAYTHPGPLYAYLNATLMADRRGDGVVQHIGPYFALLFRGLEKLDRVTVKAHRGVRVRDIKALKDTFDRYDDVLPPGRELNFWGFSSFSTSDSVATDPFFFGSAGSQGIVYSCGKLTAVDVAPLSMVRKDEAEVLPLPPLRVKVQTALKATPDKLVIAIEQINTAKDSYVVPRNLKPQQSASNSVNKRDTVDSVDLGKLKAYRLLQQISDDPLTECFSFLPAGKLEDVRLVCSRWKVLVETDTLLTSIVRGEGIYLFGGLPPRANGTDAFLKNNASGIRYPLLCNLSNSGQFGSGGRSAGRVSKLDMSGSERPRKWHYSLVVVNRKVYQFGGRADSDRLNDAEVLDPQKGKFAKLPPMEERRSAAAAHHHRGIIYILGGYDGVTPEKNSVEAFSISENKWLPAASCIVPSMPIGVTEHTAVGYKDFMFVVCGTINREQNNEKCLNVTQCFNFSTKEWTKLPPQKEPRLTPLTAVVRTNLPRRPLALLVWGGSDEKSRNCRSVEYMYLRADGSPIVNEGWHQSIPGNPSEFGNNGCAFSSETWLFYFSATSGKSIVSVPFGDGIPNFDNSQVFAALVTGSEAGKAVVVE